jgi:hypothetical protein
MNAILLELKAAKRTPGEWSEPRGIVSTVHHEISKGRFIQVTLGSAGLLIREPGKEPVGIPLPNLLDCAFAPRSAANAQPATCNLQPTTPNPEP